VLIKKKENIFQFDFVFYFKWKKKFNRQKEKQNEWKLHLYDQTFIFFFYYYYKSIPDTRPWFEILYKNKKKTYFIKVDCERMNKFVDFKKRLKTIRKNSK